jgi:nucleoside-diphosphate-sugar epimerase
MNALIIGGTRNLGPSIVHALLGQGYSVAVFNRGQTPDDLPQDVERLRGDRSDPAQLFRQVGDRSFDLVVDTTLYTGLEAEAAVEIFGSSAGRYIFLSTGQVYLVRVGSQRPFKEEDYFGPVMAEPPKSDEIDHPNWLYGHDKRQAEDIFGKAWRVRNFPYTSLRLPMVNSERDSYDRIYGYWLRLLDGGPIVIPDDPGLPVRHVYGQDVVQAILRLTQSELGKGQAYNIGQDETLTLEEFIQVLAATAGCELKLARAPREKLNEMGILRDCSPFSGAWMSSLDNARGKTELGMVYTPMRDYVKKLVEQFAASPRRQIAGYARRAEELDLARTVR